MVSLTQENSYNSSQSTHNTSIVLDVSLSMNVLDGDDSQLSRLTVAKQSIQQILQNVPGKFGLTIFSWEAQRILPLTWDTQLFLTFLSGVNRENVSEGGTDISSAISNAIYDFVDDNSGSIVLFTDGGESDFSDIPQIRKRLQEKKLQLYIIGVGTEAWWYIINGRDVFGRTMYKTYNGQRVVAKLQESWLKNLAKQLDGIYYHVSDISDGMLFENISEHSPENTEFSETLFWSFLAFGFWVYFLWHICMHKYIFWYRVWKK